MCAMHSNVMTSLPSVPFLKEFRKLYYVYMVQWTLLFQNIKEKLSLTKHQPLQHLPHTTTICNYKHPLSYVIEGHYGKANYIIVSVRAGHSAERVLAMMTDAEALCMSPSETQAETNAHPSISLSLYSHLSVLWPPAINNKTLLSNAESS